MNALTPITAELDSDTIAMVDALAAARGMTGAQFAAEAIRRVVESETDFRAFVQEGVDAADRGDVVSQEDVETWFEERVAARRGG